MIRLKAKLEAGVTEVRVLMQHPMETGRRQDATGHEIPAHFIQLVTVALNGKAVVEAQWGTGISKDPYLILQLTHATVGDQVTVTWHDNKGATETQSVPVEKA
jgi:sulfur-oxidizing protein SoxZ